MSLIKTSILSLIATIFKILSALILNKVIAVMLGPTGIALIGQFQNFIQITTTAAQGALSSGITKFISEFRNDTNKVQIVSSTAAFITISTCLFTSIFLLLFREKISSNIIGPDYDFKHIIVILSITLPLFVANNFILAVLNGLQHINIWVIVNILQNILTVILTVILIYLYDLEGALIALATSQSLVFFVLFFILKIKKDKYDYIKLISRKFFQLNFIPQLGKFALMGLTSALCIPLSHMWIRNYVSNMYGSESAGYWQSIWYISSTYLNVVTITLGVYFLPKLSSLKTNNEIRRELKKGYTLISPIIFIITISIYVLREFIVITLFNSQFLAVVSLFKWQLIGDFIKLMSWLPAYLMQAKAMTKEYIATEIFFSFLFCMLSKELCQIYGINGITLAHAVNYVLYSIVILFITKKYWN